MTNYSMFELCYDILDELTEPREINAAQVVVEQDVETQDSMTPEEFYSKFKELFCTHIFAINLMRYESMDVIEPIVHNWVEKYSPKTDFVNEEDVADVVHDNADELSVRTLEIDGRRYTIIS